MIRFVEDLFEHDIPGFTYVRSLALLVIGLDERSRSETSTARRILKFACRDLGMFWKRRWSANAANDLRWRARGGVF